MLINEPPLQTLPSLAKVFGLTAAVILQQIHYWLQASRHEEEGRPWIFNSYQEWAEQFTWLTPNAIKKQVLNLEKSGVLLSRQFNSKQGDRRKWYSIDYVCLEGMVPKVADGVPEATGIGPKVADDRAESGRSTSYKNTQKTTSEEKKGTGGKRAAPDGRIKEVFDAVLKHLGNPDIDPIPNHGKEARNIKTMLDRGYTVEHIIDFWKKKVAQKGGGYVTMVYVNEDIGHTPRQGALLPSEEELLTEADKKGLL